MTALAQVLIKMPASSVVLYGSMAGGFPLAECWRRVMHTPDGTGYFLLFSGWHYW